jgi:hypothetical protein
MGVPTSEVGYTSAITGRGDHEVNKGYVVALEKIGYCGSSTFGYDLSSKAELIFNRKPIDQ